MMLNVLGGLRLKVLEKWDEGDCDVEIITGIHPSGKRERWVQVGGFRNFKRILPEDEEIDHPLDYSYKTRVAPQDLPKLYAAFQIPFDSEGELIEKIRSACGGLNAYGTFLKMLHRYSIPYYTIAERALRPLRNVSEIGEGDAVDRLEPLYQYDWNGFIQKAGILYDGDGLFIFGADFGAKNGQRLIPLFTYELRMEPKEVKSLHNALQVPLAYREDLKKKLKQIAISREGWFGLVAYFNDHSIGYQVVTNEVGEDV